MQIETDFDSRRRKKGFLKAIARLPENPRRRCGKVLTLGDVLAELPEWRVETVAASPEAEGDVTTLSPRETECSRLIVDGCPTKIIAYKLGIKVKTAESHRYNLMRKLGVHNVAQLVRRLHRDEPLIGLA
jgi:DNA-binding CsgD family transcriptional regulator